MRIGIRSITLYLFGLVIVYLAGIYFGSFLHMLFIFFAMYPVLSLIGFFMGYVGVSCTQTFSSRHPVKGESVTYALTIANRSILPTLAVKVIFEPVSDALSTQLPDFATSLPAGGYLDKEYTVTCPFRGTYSVGIRELVFHDPLKFISLKKVVKAEKITVFPRILDLQRFNPVTAGVERGGETASANMLPDPTLFQEVREYRSGENIRHMYWKKYAATGRPVIKHYDRSKRSGVRIYVDLRQLDRWDVNQLEQEDVAIEALTALVKLFLSRKIHTSVMAAGPSQYLFAGESDVDFERFYRSTADMHFTKTGSPLKLIESDRSIGRLEFQTIIVLTHMVDADLFSANHIASVDRYIILFNRACLPKALYNTVDSFLHRAARVDAELVTIHGSDTILADLGENRYAHGG
jgi:uncharacterized protein (DUF58 family)